jgi:hypothetical protein
MDSAVQVAMVGVAGSIILVWVKHLADRNRKENAKHSQHLIDQTTRLQEQMAHFEIELDGKMKLLIGAEKKVSFAAGEKSANDKDAILKAEAIVEKKRSQMIQLPPREGA